MILPLYSAYFLVLVRSVYSTHLKHIPKVLNHPLHLTNVSTCKINTVHHTKYNQIFVLPFQYSFGADPVTTLLDPLEEELLKTTHTYCGKTHPLFTKRLAHSLANISTKAPHGR